MLKGLGLRAHQRGPKSGQGEWADLDSLGQTDMPLGKTFWSPCFGMVTDRFGVGWMVIVQPEDS